MSCKKEAGATLAETALILLLILIVMIGSMQSAGMAVPRSICKDLAAMEGRDWNEEMFDAENNKCDVYHDTPFKCLGWPHCSS